MMFARIDQRPVARWWWTVDRWTLGALFVLIGFGAVMSMAASPAVAERLGYAPLHFAERQLATVPFALAIMLGVSFLPPRRSGGSRSCVCGRLCLLLALTFVVGTEIKGARRWIIPRLLAAALGIPQADLRHRRRLAVRRAEASGPAFPERYLDPVPPLVAMLMKQPDLGMARGVAAVWFAQFFMAGLRLIWVAAWRASGAGGGRRPIPSCRMSPAASTASSIRRPATAIQVDRSLEAFVNGGWLGAGRARAR